MDMDEPLPWADLSDSAQAYIIGMIRRLADGYSGEVKVVAHEGGVRDLVETPRQSVDEFRDYG